MHLFDGILDHCARTGGGDITPLHGEMAGAFRLRLGDYRVLFTFHEDVMRIFGVPVTAPKPTAKHARPVRDFRWCVHTR